MLLFVQHQNTTLTNTKLCRGKPRVEVMVLEGLQW